MADIEKKLLNEAQDDSEDSVTPDARGALWRRTAPRGV